MSAGVVHADGVTQRCRAVARSRSTGRGSDGRSCLEDAVAVTEDPTQDQTPYEITTVVTDECIGGIRKAVRDRLAVWGMDAAEYSVSLIVSELLTNVVKHTERRRAHLRVTPMIESVSIEVADTSHVLPKIVDAKPSAESGRGLLMVAAHSSSVQTLRTQAGKRICCTVPLEPYTPAKRDLGSGAIHAAP